MGYQKDEAKTKEAFQDGYFKSGDLGKIDQDGFMWMSGRLKELLITAGGENIAPIPIENNIIAQMPDLLSYVVVVGDQRKHLSVLLTLKCLADPVSGLPTDKLDPSAIIWCETHVPGCHVNTINDVSANKDLGEVITSFINKANDKSVANPQRVQKYTILSQDLSIQGGELGPTLKLKRHVIVSKYSDLIDLMYKV
jgi:long-chain-fatty-acid--CoA ligase ACSBG